MDTEIKFTSEIKVELVQQVGNDAMIAAAARVSTLGQIRLEADTEKDAGLIRYLVKNSHSSPFEHGLLTIRVHAPIKVFREFHRHRVWSFNEESGRYKTLEPLFYIPPRERPMIRPEGFKSARPVFELSDDAVYESTINHLKAGYTNAYHHYLEMLEVGVDRGLARDVLGVGIYSSCYCTANPRSIMAFLELRTNEPTAKRPSKPLYEIEVAARKLEAIFAQYWPITYSAWIDNGRMAP